MHGIILLVALGCNHEQTVSVHTWRVEPGTTYLGRYQECKFASMTVDQANVVD
jgi:hypothetical protein